MNWTGTDPENLGIVWFPLILLVASIAGAVCGLLNRHTGPGLRKLRP